MSTAQPTMRAACMPPLFPAPRQHHMLYPSSPSSTTSSSSFWDSMPPQINIPERGPRYRKSHSPTEKTDAPPKDGGFTFITAGKPADFRSKKTMTAVRKKAMDSFLKTEKSKDSARSSAERSNSVTSDVSISQGATQPTFAASNNSNTVRQPQSSTGRKRPTATRGTAHVHLGLISSPTNQVARLQTPVTSVLQPPDLIIPSRTGIELDFDVKVVPELRSFGIPLDPFGTMFQSSNTRVSVEKLKWHCSRYFGTYGLGKHWIPYCLDHPHTFLSTLCLAAAHKDVIKERSSESLETAALRQDIIMMVGENLLNPTESVADHNIIAVSQLIICEVISRKEADLAFHEKGMEAMIEKRGGLKELGVNGRLASAVSWVNLTSAILRGANPRPIYVEFCIQNPAMNYPASATIPESPIFCPRETLLTLQRSKKCSAKTFDLLNDVRLMIDSFLDDSRGGQPNSNATTRLCMKIANGYQPIAHHVQTRIVREEEWKYEAIRITAVVLATAIIQRQSLPQSLASTATTRTLSLIDTRASIASGSTESLFSTTDNQQITPATDYSTSPSFTMVSPSPGIDPNCFPFDAHSLAASPPQASPASQRPSISSTFSSEMFQFRPSQQKRLIAHGPVALMKDLKDALENSNLSDCWSDMAGVLLWIGLVMGAASKDSESKVLSRYFSATTMRAGIMLCFDHPEAMHSTMLKMTEVVKALRSSESTGTAADVATTHKKRRA